MTQVVATSIAGTQVGSSEWLAAIDAQILETETELAGLTGLETVTEAEMAIESAGGPIGWIALAISAGVLLTVAIAVAAAYSKLLDYRSMKDALPTKTYVPDPIEPSAPIKPATPTKTSTDVIQPSYPDPNRGPMNKVIVDLFNGLPNNNVVRYSHIFDCFIDNPVRTRCDRRFW